MTVSVPDLEKHLDEYLRAVEKGETIVICRGAVSIARITGIPLRRNCTKLGFDRGRIEDSWGPHRTGPRLRRPEQTVQLKADKDPQRQSPR